MAQKMYPHILVNLHAHSNVVMITHNGAVISEANPVREEGARAGCRVANSPATLWLSVRFQSGFAMYMPPVSFRHSRLYRELLKPPTLPFDIEPSGL